MADIIDMANDTVQRGLDTVLAAHKKPNRVSGDCVECGEHIPEARQIATSGTELCFLCASTLEHKQKAYR